MTKKGTTLGKDIVAAVSKPMNSDWLQTVAIILAGIAIIASAFHFWPFEDSKIWQLLNPSNLSVLVWILLLAVLFLLKSNRRRKIISLLPHLSVFAYLIVNILSMAFASDWYRTANFTIKLLLILIGGYMLFSWAISSIKSLRLVYGLATAAVIASLSYCFLSRFLFSADKFGFHSNPYKYGTYIGTLVPLCGAYLFTSSRSWKILFGAVIVLVAFISSGSLGALAAISIGMSIAIVSIPRWSIRFYIISCIVLGIGTLTLLNSSPALAVQDDIKLAEKDGTNLKQRYIEWQAEVNLLEDHTITGTAAGCINEYRSNFYYRLPKLNTLKAFDQNGWLATGAETGILGLVCFCWIVLYYGKLAFSQGINSVQKARSPAHRFARANFIGLITACIANLFSSVHYNGILIIFALVLALISGTNQLYGER